MIVIESFQVGSQPLRAASIKIDTSMNMPACNWHRVDHHRRWLPPGCAAYPMRCAPIASGASVLCGLPSVRVVEYGAFQQSH